MSQISATIRHRPQDKVLRIELSGAAGLTAGKRDSQNLNSKTTQLFAKLMAIKEVCDVEVETDGATATSHIILVWWTAGKAAEIGEPGILAGSVAGPAQHPLVSSPIKEPASTILYLPQASLWVGSFNFS
jgi:hypothetical protein